MWRELADVSLIPFQNRKYCTAGTPMPGEGVYTVSSISANRYDRCFEVHLTPL